MCNVASRAVKRLSIFFNRVNRAINFKKFVCVPFAGRRRRPIAVER